MSQRYKGAVISATPPTVSATSPNNYGTAKGVWTLQQQLQYEGAGTWPSPFTPPYIEDVFSTYLYTGNGSTQTITNNIDLSGEGGLVWTKNRTGSSATHQLIDTVRGKNSALASQNTDSALGSSDITAFNSNGFSLGYITGNSNFNNDTYASWTFRKAEKFFDVVTYTGNGTAGRTIAHNLGSVPGCIIVKCTNTDGTNWRVYHRSLGATYYLGLESTAAAAQATTIWNDTEPTSTVFSVGTSANTNESGWTFVAYLFAHDAGGFGDAGDQSVIKCGSFAHNFSGATVNLGWEPQWVLVKAADQVNNWYIFDNMRGIATGGDDAALFPNLSDAENLNSWGIDLTATGFTVSGNNILSSGNAIYIAIRRGPMKTPEAGTEVLVPYAYDGSGAGTYTTGINQDLFFAKSRNSGSYVWNWYDRLRGANKRLQSNATYAEASVSGVTDFNNTSMIFATSDGFSSASPFGGPYIGYAFRRAPGFFDVVCYTGTGSARTISHNLGVVPELIITKKRSNTSNWATNDPSQSNPWSGALLVNTADAFTSSSAVWNNTAPTSSVFTVGTADAVNISGQTYVAYLFASCPNVSKVGSYTGTGTTLQVNCGFTNGARFVMIKRTDSTGNWYVWDAARGIVAGNDPYLLINSSAAEVTNTDYVDTYSAGFEISNTAPAEINANGGTFIYLAIA